MTKKSGTKKRRRRKNLLPVTLTIRECEKRGWVPELVERQIPGTFIRKDAFGLADVAALAPGRCSGTFYIQATSRGHHGTRRKKALESPNLRTLLETGNTFVIWSWVCTRDEEELREEELTLEDLVL